MRSGVIVRRSGPTRSPRAWLVGVALTLISVGTIVPEAGQNEVHAASAEPASPTPREAAVLKGAEHLAKSIEAWEDKGESVFFQSENRTPELQKASNQLRAYSKQHPADVRALVLQARILRALMVVTPVGFQTDEKGTRTILGDNSKLRSDGLGALDQVLSLDPTNAEAYYWKARILSLYAPTAEDLATGEQHQDFGPILDAARKAASLAPANTTYAEYLGLALLANGQKDEAVQQFKMLPGRHPVLQLLDDVASIPLPPGTEPDKKGWAELWTEGFSGHLDVFKYPGLRAFVYTTSSSLKNVVAFYTAAWPKIRFKTQQFQTLDSANTGFLWREGRLEPADPALFMEASDKQLPPSGLVLLLSQRMDRQPATTLIVIMNLRRF